MFRQCSNSSFTTQIVLFIFITRQCMGSNVSNLFASFYSQITLTMYLGACLNSDFRLRLWLRKPPSQLVKPDFVRWLDNVYLSKESPSYQLKSFFRFLYPVSHWATRYYLVTDMFIRERFHVRLRVCYFTSVILWSVFRKSTTKQQNPCNLFS